MSETQKMRRAKRLLSMVEREREQARNELALSNQKLHAAQEERADAEQRLLVDVRGTGQAADWMLAELDQEHGRRVVREKNEQEKRATQEVVSAEAKATQAHNRHRIFERFHDNIATRIDDANRRRENLETDAFALTLWAKKQSGEGPPEEG